MAGASADAEYVRLRDRHAERVLREHPRLGRVRLAIGAEPESITAWSKGAAGERRVGAVLDGLTSCGAGVLHDRRIPGSRANIDHIVVAPSGVWIVDTKCYRGRVECRDHGRLLRTDLRLTVDGRDRSNLVRGMSKQVAAVSHALDRSTVTIRPVLCFTGSQWPLLRTPFTVDGVLVIWPDGLAKTIARAADRSVDASRIFTRLSERLPRS